MLENGYLLVHSDCVSALMQMPDACVDAIVTDPPYELGFMGKVWDASGIANNVEMWREALRVLKPGGHMLAFSGSRTYHRMTCAIEDAGFEIRDQIMWLYGSGFPKSLDVSKAIDKAAGVEFDAVPAGGVGFMNAEGAGGYNVTKNQLVRKGESTEAARQWQGWGTALKPAHEPICVARKPLVGTVAENVLKHGTGAINVDGCRVPTGGEQPKGSGARESWRAMEGRTDLQPHGENVTPEAGRWPANLIHDGSDDVVAGFPDSNGSGPARKLKRSAKPDQQGWGMNTTGADSAELRDAGTGSAARFFYCAKASRKDRNEGLEEPGPQFKRGTTLRQVENTDTTGNTHPTVKPTELMRYLVRLVTPPGGVVLDPFMGSGSTGKAAMLEGFRFVGVDMSAEYVEIARARIQYVTGEDLC